MGSLRSFGRKAKRTVLLPPPPPRPVVVKTEKTYWNGEPAHCRRVIVRVGTVEKPTWWCAGLEGTERKAVEVNYYGQKFYLDDENGSAWRKVTLGGGGPEWGHSSLPDDSEVISVEEGEQ